MRPSSPWGTGIAAAPTAARFLLGLFNASLTAFAIGALFTWTRGLLGRVPGATGE